jgi:hypothetical protein
MAELWNLGRERQQKAKARKVEGGKYVEQNGG